MILLRCKLPESGKAVRQIKQFDPWLLGLPGFLLESTVISKTNDMHYPQNPEEQWRIQKAKLKLMFSQLHDEDFLYDYGMKEVMMMNLQVKLGKSRDELNLLLVGL